jgi:hypothetical protein
MNPETVKAIMDAMQSGMTQGEANKHFGISRNTIGKVCRANGYKADKSELQRKAYAKFEAKQIELFGVKPKVFKPVTRVTTSHVRLPQAEGYSSALYWFDDLENVNRKSKQRENAK